VERALAGEEEATVEVARRAREIARRVLGRCFWCSHDIEDCAQETVIRVLTRLPQLRDAERFEGWVATIARRVALARQRDRATLPLGGLATAGEVPSAGSALQREVSRAQQRLSAARRELLTLRYRRGLSYAEIAEALETTVPRVRRRLQGARDQLRKETMKLMAHEKGEAVGLSRNDLDGIYAAAALIDPEHPDAVKSNLRALHTRGRTVFGGTTHRAAIATLECQDELPELRLDGQPFLQLLDHPDVSSGYLGWDEEGAHLALDDGTVVDADHIDCHPLNPKAWVLAELPLPHSAEVSRAELLELSEQIAGASWGHGDDAVVAAASLVIVPGEHGQIGATVFRPAPVTFMMSGSIGCISDASTHLQTFINRGYLRDCVAALPRAAERVRVEFGGRLDVLRLSAPSCPGVAVMVMPMRDQEAWDRYDKEHVWPAYREG
jgi:RNA polymerase sigma-70 factor (ECF subfamily)